MHCAERGLQQFHHSSALHKSSQRSTVPPFETRTTTVPGSSAKISAATVALLAPLRWGDTLLWFGEMLSCFGETVPWFGETVPWFGETVPWFGETVPWFGETVPWFGETVPWFGSDEALCFGDEAFLLQPLAQCNQLARTVWCQQQGFISTAQNKLR